MRVNVTTPDNLLNVVSVYADAWDVYLKSLVTVKISSTTAWTSAWTISAVVAIFTLPFTIARLEPIALKAARVAGEVILTSPENTEELANNSAKSAWFAETASVIAWTSAELAAEAVLSCTAATDVAKSANPSANAASPVAELATLVCNEATVFDRAEISDWTWDKPATTEASALICVSRLSNWSS